MANIGISCMFLGCLIPKAVYEYMSSRTEVKYFSGEDTEFSSGIYVIPIEYSKGLEFDEVFMTGMEDGLFPGNRSIDDPKELEEERRLCYVGITRAKRRLTMTYAKSRMINGETRWANESMFLREIPGELKEETDRLSPGVRKAFRDTKRSSSEGHLYPWETGISFGSGKSASAGPSGVSPYGGSFGASSEARRKRPAPAFGKQFQVVKADHLDYAEGDQVRHSRFGTGTVLRITEGGRDFEVTVDFKDHGIKKMFAGFAKLQKV